MAIVVIEAVAPIASWRPPEALTYHRTLPLPPYTSLVGTLGAALGLSLPESYRYVSERGLRLGVGGWHEGQARDLWKFQKLELVDKAKQESKTDVLLREVWIDARMALVIEAPDDHVEAVAHAFRKPAFPLTAGPSDSLMKAVDVRVEDVAPRSTRSLSYSMIYGELPPRYKLAEAWDRIPLTRTIRAPSVERLPIGFTFESESPRRMIGRDLVTFVVDPIELENDVEPIVGYPVEPRSQALRRSPSFQTSENAPPWIIPVHRYDFPPMPADGSSTTRLPSGGTRKRGRKPNPTDSM